MQIYVIAFTILITILLIQISSAATYAVGYVNNALDGISANDQIVVLWNPANGINDNLTDVIGPNGKSGVDNIYLFDCEELVIDCAIGDEIRVKIINNGSNYITGEVSRTITGEIGYELMPNLTLNSPPRINTTFIDDSFNSPAGEIDLTPASITSIRCEGTIYEYDGDSSLMNVSARFFDTITSSYDDSDDNNRHYANDSCTLNTSYGNANEAVFNCTLNVQYYANSGNWSCVPRAYDNVSISGEKTNTTFINPLLALSIPSPIDFGTVNTTFVSSEQIINVTNAGNVIFNLTLSGYGRTPGDNNSMNCTLGETKNISINYMKYNLTMSNTSTLTLGQLESLYTNLTSTTATKRFNLNYRQNDTNPYIDDTNSTYWRIYVPVGVAGSCQGNIVFGAIRGDGT